MVAGAGDRPAAAAVVDERVARLLEHPLLVADDDLRGAQLEQSLEPVVAVDDAPVEVVQVGGREAAAVELDHRSQVRRDDRQDGQDHPVRSRAGAAEGLDEAQPLDRLLAALARARPDLDVERASQLLEVHPADDLAHGLGAHPGPEDAAALGAGAVALVQVAVLGLAERLHRLERFELVAQLAQLVLGPLRLLLELLALVAQRVVHRGSEVVDLLLDGARLVGLALLEVGVHLLGVFADDLAQASGRFLAALVAGRHHDLAGRGEGDGLGGDAGLELGERRLGHLGDRGDLLGPGGALGLELRLGPGELGVELVLRLVQLGLELVLAGGERLAGLAATTLGLFLDRGQGALARVLIDVGDDVQREVEDALEVARADVEQDPEAARRALEIPDVADRAGQLDVAHPLAADLRARDLDAALVADDALVADPLVLAAVALPVLGRAEDALVEEAVLLRLERSVVDGLGLRDLALRPLPDLVRAGERDADRAEVIDFEHGSPPRRRLARQRDADRERAETCRPWRASAGVGSGTGSVAGASILEPGEVDPPEVGQEVAGGVVLGQGDLLFVRIEDLGVETEAAQFLDEHLEGLGHARRLDLLALDDGFVCLDASEDVVRLDREQLLQDVRGPVGLERPDLHLAEALAAELRLATERLLGDQAVRAGRPGVDLVLDEVVELEHVDVADGDRPVEQLAGPPVAELGLAVLGQARPRSARGGCRVR